MDLHNLTDKERSQARDQYIQLDFPHSYSISFGEYPCNRFCRMCPMFNEVPEERYITDEVMERALSEFGPVRTNTIELSAYGETFQHPKADEYIALARKRCPKAYIVVATNGSLLNRERCERIVDSGINYLSFSLDAGSAETYQWLTKSTKYEQTCKNLETLIEVRNKRGAKHLKITTHIIGIKELAHEFDAFVKKWGPITDGASVRTYGNWAGLVDNNGVSPAEKQVIPEKRYPCAWLWYSTKIEPNGDVSKCFVHVTGDKNPIGNIMRESFESIWRGEKMRMLRDNHIRQALDNVEFCKTCMVWSVFPNFWKEKRQFMGLGEKKWQY